MPLASSYSYPLLGAFWTILEIFLWVLWIWVLIYVFIDIFRSHDLSGWAKALWFIFVLFIPLIGVLVYLIARGDSMHERAAAAGAAAGPGGPSPTSRRPPARRTRPTSSPSWPTCVTGESSRPMSSSARRPRSWPEHQSAGYD